MFLLRRSLVIADFYGDKHRYSGLERVKEIIAYQGLAKGCWDF